VSVIIDELFPSPTSRDLLLTKVALGGYKKKKGIVNDFENNNGHKIQEDAYLKAKEATRNIERAVNLILDEETRRIMEYRFLKGYNHKTTVLHFRSIMGDRTVDRKIIDGIEAVADTLKLWGYLTPENDGKSTVE